MIKLSFIILGIDFPSKILLYIKNDLTVFSTLSKSIPNIIKDSLMNFKYIEEYIVDINEEVINPDYNKINQFFNEKCLNTKLRNFI